MNKTALVIEKEVLTRNSIAHSLKHEGFHVSLAETPKKARSYINRDSFDLIILDTDFFKEDDDLIKIEQLHSQVITLSSSDKEKTKNSKNLIKPFSHDDLMDALIQPDSHYDSIPIIAQSTFMQDLLEKVDLIAKSEANVFIHGESGTGKEVIAQAIHDYSQRSKNPFIKVNCAALSPSLIESEFFGHEKGSFTGAENRYRGRLERAHLGTLLLDEVTEICSSLQAKLLRAIQEQEFERVGSTETISIDVRFISTSNRNLNEELKKKTLRSDLFYRLNVIPIFLPPLRERKEEIKPLAHYYLKQLTKKNNKPTMSLSQSAIKKLYSYSWPGNIRELINVIERSVVLSKKKVLHAKDIYLELFA